MSFWDNVKKFAQPYADEDYDDYDDEELDDYEEEEIAASAPRTSRRTPAFGSSSTSDSGLDFGSASSAAPVSSPVSTSSSSFSGHVLNMNAGNKQEVVLFHAKAFDDAARAANELRSKRAIILNMENVDKALTRRVVDFLSGTVYALDGSVKKIAQSTYLFCPHNMDVVGDLENIQSEIENYI